MPVVSLELALKLVGTDVEKLLSSVPVPLGEANPPDVTGVYMLIERGEVVYVGEAKGSRGLRDRLLRKHLSGDDNHAVQRAYKAEFPDRSLRREHMKKAVSAQWLPISDPAKVSVVERLLIWLYNPPWNKK